MNPKRDMGYDRTRGNVALAKLCMALGVDCDGKRPDHELLEDLAEAARNAAALRAGEHLERVKQIQALCEEILTLRATQPPKDPE